MTSRRRKQPDIPAQGDLFSGAPCLRTRVIAKRADFDDLFEGFVRMRAISYVVSLDLLLEFFEKRGYIGMEVVVGENMSETYRRDLEQAGPGPTERLAGFVESGALRIMVPATTIHTKLYLLEREDIFRVIQASANLTLTAQDARQQVNYAWYMDLPKDHPTLRHFEEDYTLHLKGCQPFMDDLTELLRQSPATDRKQVIEAWLKGGVSEDQDVELRGVIEQLTASLVVPAEASDSSEERVAVLKLPDAAPARKRVERQLAAFKAVSAGQNQVRVSGSAFIRYVYETHRVPMMALSGDRKRLLLASDSALVPVSQPLPGPDVLGAALAHLESYLDTVDFGESPEPVVAKTSMFEALLYMFFAPFAHEYMKAKRARFGLIDKRGPRFLYIYGPSQNGKSTFLRFALKLMAERPLEALSRDDFLKSRITSAMAMQSIFPLVFDDVDSQRFLGSEDVFKSYWERWWRDQYPSPQIVIASNSARLQEWAKSRVKRIDFNVHFAAGETAKERLARLFEEKTGIFAWFSHEYLDHLNRGEPASDDELDIARKVMKDLYAAAQRPLPEHFPSAPVEKLYDPGRRDWRDLLYQLRQATVEDDGSRKLIRFSQDMQPWEVRDYEAYLPQTVKHRRRGNTIIIESPREFDRWLGRSRRQGLWSRLLGRSAPS